MDAKEIALLIAQLRKENENNSIQERNFNLKWIKMLKESLTKAFPKKDNSIPIKLK